MTPSIDGARAADVLVVYNFSRAGLADSSGRVVSASAARTRVSLDFRLLLASGTWLIDDVQIVSNGTAA